MPKLTLINENKDIQPNKILLLIDKEDKKIRGIDKVHTIDNATGDYLYESLISNEQKGIKFKGNIVKFFSLYDVYLVDEDFAKKYSDQSLHHSLLSWDYNYVFEYLFDSKIANEQWDKLMSIVSDNITARISFIDLTNRESELLSKIIFLDTQKDVTSGQIRGLKDAIYTLQYYGADNIKTSIF